MRKLIETGLILFTPHILLGFGCSLIGLGIGAAIDNSSDGIEAVNLGLQKITVGEEITVLLRDGSMLSGAYGGTVSSHPEEYAEQYDTFSEKLPDSLPRPGDSVDLVYSSSDEDRTISGTLIGYGLAQVVVHPAGTTPVRIALSRVLSVQSEGGHRTEGVALRTMIYDGRVPTLDGLLVGNIYSPFDEVLGIEVSEGGNAKWILFGVGVVVDAIMVLAFVSAMNDAGDACAKGITSSQ